MELGHLWETALQFLFERHTGEHIDRTDSLTIAVFGTKVPQTETVRAAAKGDASGAWHHCIQPNFRDRECKYRVWATDAILIRFRALLIRANEHR